MSLNIRFLAVMIVCAVGIHAQVLLNEDEKAEVDKEPVVLTDTTYVDQDNNQRMIEIGFSMRPHVHVYLDTALNFAIHIKNKKGLGQARIVYPSQTEVTIVEGDSVKLLGDGDRILLSFAQQKPEWEVAGYISYQACDTARCFFPETAHFYYAPGDEKSGFTEESIPADASGIIQQKQDTQWKSYAEDFSIEGTRTGYMSVPAFVSFLDNPAQGSAAGSAFMNMPVWSVILLVIVGGLALNFTPCVLPVIPITLAILGAGARASSRLGGFAVGAVYGMGMVLSYGLLGVVVILTGKTFGFINSSPLFNAAISLLFIVLSLAMFDVFHIDLTRFRGGGNAQGNGKKGAFAAFGMGIVTAILAGACVAPVVISVVLYATTLYSAGTSVALLLPFVLGFGMALPWPFAGAGLSLLPKPGNWMVAVRNVFGVIILIVGLVYGYTAVKIVRARMAADTVSASAAEEKSQQWYSSLDKGLAAARAEDAPVLIDFTAPWCKNCKAMHATTLKNDEVEKRLKRFVTISWSVESPDDSDVKEVLEYFDVVGMPTYVIMKPRTMNQ